MKGWMGYLTAILGFALLALLLQSAVLRLILPTWAVPNFLLIGTVFVAFHLPTARGSLIAFVLGLFVDISSAQLLGPNAGAFVAVFCVLAALSQRVFVQAPLTLAFTIFGSSIFGSLVYWLITFEFKDFGGHFFLQLLGAAFVTALVSPLVIASLNWLIKPDRERVSGGARRRGRR